MGAADLRKYWPSRAVNVNAIAAQYGFSDIIPKYRRSVDTELVTRCAACPMCGDADSELSFELDGPMTCGLVCPSCHHACDLVSYAAHLTKRPAGVVVAELNELGAFSSKRSVDPSVFRAFQRYRAAQVAFDRFQVLMTQRRMSSVAGSDVHTTYRIVDNPHRIDRWWCSTVGELDAHLRGHTDPSGPMSSVLGAPDDRPVLLIPVHGSGNPLVGMWASAGSAYTDTNVASFVYLKVPGSAGGVGIDVGPQTQFTCDPHVALTSAVAYQNGVCRGVRRVLVPPVTPNVMSYFRIRSGAEMVPSQSAAFVRSAAALDASVLNASNDELEPWEVWFSRWLYDRGRGSDPDMMAAWTPAVSRRSVGSGRITEAQAELIDRLVLSNARPKTRTSAGPIGSVPIRRGLTVTVTENGFVWDEKAELLCRALVQVSRIYRGDDGRVRYRGYVLYGGVSHPFDTSRFRKDPCGVVERAVLRSGMDPPPVHPALAPHLAAIVLYRR